MYLIKFKQNHSFPVYISYRTGFLSLIFNYYTNIKIIIMQYFESKKTMIHEK